MGAKSRSTTIAPLGAGLTKPPKLGPREQRDPATSDIVNTGPKSINGIRNWDRIIPRGPAGDNLIPQPTGADASRRSAATRGKPPLARFASS